MTSVPSFPSVVCRTYFSTSTGLKSVQFTVEHKSDGCLFFLDVQIFRAPIVPWALLISEKSLIPTSNKIFSPTTPSRKGKLWCSLWPREQKHIPLRRVLNSGHCSLCHLLLGWMDIPRTWYKILKYALPHEQNHPQNEEHFQLSHTSTIYRVLMMHIGPILG